MGVASSLIGILANSVPFIGILDILTLQPIQAASSRRLTVTYTGPCMRVRRSSDNAELDIGFTASGDLDTGTLMAFVGAGATDDGFVVTWYSQVSAAHFANASAASQPKIVEAGVLLTIDGRPNIRFKETRNTFLLAAGSSQAFLAARMVVSANTVPDFGAYLYFNVDRQGGLLIGDDDSSPSSRLNILHEIITWDPLATLTFAALAPTRIGFDAIMAGGGSTGRLNGATQTGSGLAFGVIPGGNFFSLGGANGGSRAVDGFISEVLIFNAAMSAGDNTTIDASQLAYFGT